MSKQNISLLASLAAAAITILTPTAHQLLLAHPNAAVALLAVWSTVAHLLPPVGK